MSAWLNPVANLVVGAVTLALVVKYRDRGILRRIGDSKPRFRAWLKSGVIKPDQPR
jgi:hypothetical protein